MLKKKKKAYICTDHKHPRMRFLVYILFWIGFGFVAVGQTLSGHGVAQLLASARDLRFENPDEAIKIGEHVLKNADSDAVAYDANLLLAESHSAKGANSSALVCAFNAKQNAEKTKNNARVIRATVLIAQMLKYLKLDEPAQGYLECARLLADKETNRPIAYWFNGKSITQAALTDMAKGKPADAIVRLRNAEVQYSKLSNPERSDLKNQTHINKAIAFTAMGQNDSAAFYFDRALAYFKKNDGKNLFGLAKLRLEMSKLYLRQHQHDLAIADLLEAHGIAEKLQNTALLKDLNKQLAVNYLARNDRSSYHRYNQQVLTLSNQAETNENEATNTAFNLISQEQEAIRMGDEQQYANIFYGALACFLLILFIGGIQLFRNKSKQKKYREILQYFESANNPTQVAAVKKMPAKMLNIPAETEQTILAKLKKFESSVKFTNNEMSLAMLAAQVDTNTKYLSEIINKHYQDNFNTYINKLRVNYIIGKLKSEPAYLNYKISYLAEESGFSSHSSFATIFKSITGIAPTTFIEILKEASHKTVEA